MSKEKAEALDTIRARLDEMRGNMEQLASEIDALGLKGLSFQPWREALDRNDEKLKAEAQRQRDADRT